MTRPSSFFVGVKTEGGDKKKMLGWWTKTNPKVKYAKQITIFPDNEWEEQEMTSSANPFTSVRLQNYATKQYTKHCKLQSLKLKEQEISRQEDIFHTTHSRLEREYNFIVTQLFKYKKQLQPLDQSNVSQLIDTVVSDNTALKYSQTCDMVRSKLPLLLHQVKYRIERNQTKIISIKNIKEQIQAEISLLEQD